MEFVDTEFDGLKIVKFFRAPDDRGVFIKPWLSDELKSVFGNISETYFSYSNAKVFRGLHYQLGDKAQKKYVICLSGSIEDVAVDLRKDSGTYGKVFRMRLSGMGDTGVIIPAGFLHGIYAYEPSVIVNFCDKPYSPGDEGGYYYGSIKQIEDLEVKSISDKDSKFPNIEI